MKNNKVVPFLIAIAVFVIVSLAYFAPVLEGKKLFQSDIAQFKGVSKEIVDFRAEHNQEPYWTNRVFGGMPAYNVSAYYPHNYIKSTSEFSFFSQDEITKTTEALQQVMALASK